MGLKSSIETKSVCLVISNDYAAPAAATICSLLINNPGNWNVFVISDNLSETNQTKLSSLVKSQSNNATFVHIKAGMADFNKFPKGIITNHVSQHALFKFLIAELLPLRIESVLYLDSDVVVTGNLKEIFETSSPLPVLAVKDFGYHDRRRQFGIPTYFNSGVMLLNLKVWRQNQFCRKILEAEIPEWNKFVDQDILNNFFKNNWLPIASQYNVPASVMYSSRANQLGFPKNQACIVHFLGGLKPWDYWLIYSPLYWRFIVKTPYRWSALQIPRTMIRSLIYKLKRIRK